MSFRPARILFPLLIILGLVGAAPNAQDAAGDTSLGYTSTLTSGEGALDLISTIGSAPIKSPFRVTMLKKV